MLAVLGTNSRNSLTRDPLRGYIKLRGFTLSITLNLDLTLTIGLNRKPETLDVLQLEDISLLATLKFEYK